MATAADTTEKESTVNCEKGMANIKQEIEERFTYEEKFVDVSTVEIEDFEGASGHGYLFIRTNDNLGDMFIYSSSDIRRISKNYKQISKLENSKNPKIHPDEMIRLTKDFVALDNGNLLFVRLNKEEFVTVNTKQLPTETTAHAICHLAENEFVVLLCEERPPSPQYRRRRPPTGRLNRVPLMAILKIFEVHQNEIKEKYERTLSISPGDSDSDSWFMSTDHDGKYVYIICGKQLLKVHVSMGDEVYRHDLNELVVIDDSSDLPNKNRRGPRFNHKMDDITCFHVDRLGNILIGEMNYNGEGNVHRLDPSLNHKVILHVEQDIWDPNLRAMDIGATDGDWPSDIAVIDGKIVVLTHTCKIRVFAPESSLC